MEQWCWLCFIVGESFFCILKGTAVVVRDFD